MFDISITDCYETRDLIHSRTIWAGRHAIEKAELHLGFGGRPVRETALRVLDAARTSSLIFVEKEKRHEHLRYTLMEDANHHDVPIVMPFVYDSSRGGYVVKTLLIYAECEGQLWKEREDAWTAYQDLINSSEESFKREFPEEFQTQQP